MADPLLLAIDVGNTNTVLGLYRGREPRGQWRMSTDRRRTEDEYAAFLLRLMPERGLHARDVAAAVIGSVVPQTTGPLRRLCERYFDCPAQVLGTDLSAGIEVALDNPSEVGADRILNAVGVHARYDGAHVIVDFGTATTFDVVDADGVYRGGVIAPGINLSIEALHLAAAQLPRVEIAAPDKVIGTGTVGAMQSGVFWGYVGVIEGLVARIKAEFGTPMRVLATGGLADLFAGATDAIDGVDHDLTMAGLVEVYHRNRPAK